METEGKWEHGNGPVMPEDDKEPDRVILHKYGKAPEPCKVKLIKQSKTWAWEISIQGDNFDDMLQKINDVNETMKLRYGNMEA